MLEPDLDPEFYEEQIKKMTQRYELLFKKWKVNWDKYFDNIKIKLKGNQYWIWCYLCGFEKFIQDESWKKNDIQARLYKDANDRCWRLIGDFYQNQEYMRNL